MKNPFHGKKGLDQLPKKDTMDEEHYNIITVPNVTALEISSLFSYLSLGLKWNCTCMYILYNDNISRIHSRILNIYKFEYQAFNEWNQAINKMREDIETDFEDVLPQFEGGCKPVALSDTYIQEFKKELLGLNRIRIIDETSGKEHDQFIGVEQLIGEIKDEVKKGNRVSFKLMQELQSTIESLSSNSSGIEKEAIENAIMGYEKKADSFIKLSLKAIDSMDLIYQSAIKTDLKDWASQIRTVNEDFLSVLETFGIEELLVEGAFFDGETMISIGTVDSSFAPNLERYQVYAVHERGFRNKETGALIREAKVATIY